MHAGAALGYWRDSADQRRIRERLLSPACGFTKLGPESAWTWVLEQEELAAEVHRVQGSLVEAAGVIGA